jgi:signal transduction histidine kinase
MKDMLTELARDKEVPALIASTPASAQQRRIAFGVVIFLSVVFVAITPFATIQVARVNAFIPVVHSIVCFADLVTAVFLFAQYSIQPQRALLALASGYIVSGLFAFFNSLDFPGAYSATGLLSGTPSGASWLFFFYRIIFALAVITYVLLKDGNESANHLEKVKPARAIALTIACALAVIAGLTWTLIADAVLPSLYVDATRQTSFTHSLAGWVWLLNAIALVLLFVRSRTILDVWLVVMVFVSLPDLTLAFFYSAVRFSVGWYMAKTYVLIASCTVLVVLLWETTILYGRLASTITLLRRERANRLMSVDAATAAIAHEIAQPLTGISTHCLAALNWLNRTPPNLEKVSDNLTASIDGSRRAAEVIASTRAVFKPTARLRTMIDLNGVARQVLGMLEHDLHEHGVSVSTAFQEDLPRIMADGTQLQQVIVNLIKNAIDAMNAGAANIKHLRLITSQSGNSVVSLSVRDSGPGIDLRDEARIFDPFFTTKPSGVGLGLSICRKIVEGHGGELRLAKMGSIGCAFEIWLPIVATTDG